MIKESIIKQSFEAATERYAALGVDAKLAMEFFHHLMFK